MLTLLLLLGLIAGAVIPVQTSINSKLSGYTQSALYASAISFSVGTLCLILINLMINPAHFSAEAFGQYHFNFYWYLGGLMGVIFLTGNMVLFPKIGASLTVVSTITGQIFMGVLIDTFGWFNAHIQPISIVKAFGILLLLLGIILMNFKRNAQTVTHAQQNTLWMVIAMIIGFAPPVQTAINSHLGQAVHSPYFASLISFTVGAFVLVLLTLIIHRRFKIRTADGQHESLQWWHFIGGALGVIFVTTNIILTPYIGVTLTLITVMLGQIMMGLLIDHFGLLGVPPRRLTKQRMIGLTFVIIALVIIQFN